MGQKPAEYKAANFNIVAVSSEKVCSVCGSRNRIIIQIAD